MCEQSTAYNTYATMSNTNPQFMGFSRSQNVNKEIGFYIKDIYPETLCFRVFYKKI